jgi:hypothetical protein
MAENENEEIDYSNTLVDTDEEDNTGLDDDVEQSEQVNPPPHQQVNYQKLNSILVLYNFF